VTISELSAVLIGSTPVMSNIHKMLQQVSASRATVLIRGESGTGKELVARLIHEGSPRAKKPFVCVHCAALSESLLESELFGHEQGAFTGAVRTRRGRFELASGGTLFLDEIGDLSPTVQIKLLRVLQDMSFERVGGAETLSVDVRLVAATHRNLEEAVRENQFRQDLYYRLNVVPCFLPPLRERVEDIPWLVTHFLKKYNEENAKNIKLAASLMDLFSQYDWPGNIRELENCIERLVVLSEHETLTLKGLPSAIAPYFKDIREVVNRHLSSRTPSHSLAATLCDVEQTILQDTLDRLGWVQAQAARALGITARQVTYKIKKYGLRPREPGLLTYKIDGSGSRML